MDDIIGELCGCLCYIFICQPLCDAICDPLCDKCCNISTSEHDEAKLLVDEDLKAEHSHDAESGAKLNVELDNTVSDFEWDDNNGLIKNNSDYDRTRDPLLGQKVDNKCKMYGSTVVNQQPSSTTNKYIWDKSEARLL